MDLFVVDRQTCDKDGICAAVCPAGIIDYKKGEWPAPTAEADAVCIRCGHCVAVCPTGSLSHREMPVEKCPPTQEELRLSAAQCEQFLRSRRSIRTYMQKTVPRKELARLIDLARYAPTGSNSQGVEWLVLGNRDEVKRLAGLTVDCMRRLLGDGADIASSLRYDRVIRRWDHGEDVIFRGAPVLIVTHAAKTDFVAPVSSTIALSYLELAATGMGLGSCWAGYFHMAATTFPPLMEVLPIPGDHRCLGAMMVGYPEFGYHRLPLRKPPSITWRLA
jgi:nitroreductase/NAD-dependent dihydropyrimidine dehydrogenase PreA subunit